MREMLIHYESIINEKHQTEKNLNKALDLLYNKTLSYHRYYEWRVGFIEKKRQKYALSLAKHFYEEKIKRVGCDFIRTFQLILFFFLLLESIKKLEKYDST